MKAVVYKGPGVVALEEHADPHPGAGEVLVAVRAVGICGSDIHGFSGATGRRAPGIVMGHEVAGVVVGRGPGVARPRPGSRAAIFPILSCHRCDACLRGQPQVCGRRRVLGVQIPGAFSEYLVVPAGNCRPLRRTTQFAEGALAEPLAVGLHAVALAGVRRGMPAAVLGAGGIGLCVLLAYRLRGASPVFVTDLVPERLAVAEALGGIPVRARDADPVDRILRDAGPLEGVVDAVGSAGTLRQALALASSGGRVVVVGMGAPTVELPLYDLITQERVLVGSYAYTAREYARAVTLINRGRLDVTPLIGRTCALSDLPEVLPRILRGEITVPRVVVGVGNGG
ncbi:MAG TPA: alcohol dehydrogenase catalytic domain-containing protein [bacterium]|nr:alcohol dehydrogenase catalytic domain-containing protein [bacterium]